MRAELGTAYALLMAIIELIDGANVEYLLRPGGRRLAVLFHGGHMRADLEIGHEAFIDAGYSVLQPSRPGYGGTPLAAGSDNAAFTDRVARLAEHLGYQDIVAVGVSAGGRTAMTFAARHPRLVTALILESSTSFLPWPDRLTRAIASVVFRPHLERATWATTRLAFGLFPGFMLRRMLSSLSTIPAATAYQQFDVADRARLVHLLSRMRSGRGFLNDLREPDDVAQLVKQPTLVVASRNDAAVGAEYAQSLARSIEHATLVVTDSLSHFLWIGPHSEQERHAVTSFLSSLTRPRTTY